MCLILFALKPNPQYKFVLMANRDEFFNRATQEAHRWSDHNIIAGKDKEGGGTWLGITEKGRFTAITNYRDLQNIQPNAPTRGWLTLDYLKEPVNPAVYAQEVLQAGGAYNGFNLLVGDFNQLFYVSNYHNETIQLEAGIHGLSNGLLDEPWPKVALGKKKLQIILEANEVRTEDLLSAMQDTRRAALETLPHTGIPVDKELALSSMFIEMEGYGTRCSTAILVDWGGNTVFHERTYDATGSVLSEIKIDL